MYFVAQKYHVTEQTYHQQHWTELDRWDCPWQSSIPGMNLDCRADDLGWKATELCWTKRSWINSLSPTAGYGYISVKKKKREIECVNPGWLVTIQLFTMIILSLIFFILLFCTCDIKALQGVVASTAVHCRTNVPITLVYVHAIYLFEYACAY
jgi:hypothetical protein